MIAPVTLIHITSGIVTIGLTFLASWWDASVPYFPIEISRTATGETSSLVFSTGMTLIVFDILRRSWSNDGFIPSLWVSCLGIFVLAQYNDEKYWGVHMFGVFLFLVGTALYTYKYAWKHKRYFIIAVILYLLRIVCKIIVVFAYELAYEDRFWLVFSPFTPAIWVAILGKIHEQAHCLMMHGTWSNEFITPIVFKTCGILQWILLGLCASIYTH